MLVYTTETKVIIGVINLIVSVETSMMTINSLLM